MRLDKLTVHRMPGIPLGFQVETPAAVNIIIGPNGSGKSSLARAMRRLLWSNLATESPFAVEAIFQRDGSTWKASREEGVDTRWLLDGETAAAPSLPGGHVARCYELGLLDLVLPADGEVENQLAAAINREMSGGVNLDEVGGKIFSFGSRKANKYRAEWQKAESNLKKLVRDQFHLAQQERDLTEKRRELEKSGSSALRYELLSKLKTRGEVAENLKNALSSLNSFAQGQNQVRLEDVDYLATMRQQQQEKNRKIRERQTVLDTILEKIENVALPVSTVEALDPGLLAKQVQKTADLQGEIDRLRDELAREDNALRQVLREMNPAADDKAVGPDPGPKIYADLAKMFFRLKDNQAQTEGLESLLHLPEFQTDGKNQTKEQSEDQIREKEAALGFLRRWLVSDSPQHGIPQLSGLVSGLVATISGWLLFAYNGRIEGLIALVLGGCSSVFFLIWMWRSRAQSKIKLEQVASKLQQAGLDIPEPLDRTHIQTLLGQETRDASANQVRKNLHNYLSNRIHRQQSDEDEIKALLDQLRQKHGLAMDRETPELLHLLNAVPRYRKAQAQVASLKISLDLKQGELDKLLADIGPTFVAFGLGHPATDVEAIRQQEILENRIVETSRLRENQKKEEQDLANLHSDLKEIKSGLTNFWTRLGLSTDTDDFQVRKLVDELPTWLEKKEAVSRLQQEYDLLDKEFRKHPEILDPANAETLTPEQINLMLDTLQSDVEARDSIQHDIGATEALVNQARGSLKVAEAGVAFENARTDLLETRQQERDAALGMMILEDVEQAYHHASRPRVLSRAAESFKVFSQGRYELRVVPGAEKSGTFRAFDQESAESLGLAELSDGTRAQLLLAVRLAFISEHETDAKPPVFLDESLTSSDPQRFEAIAVNLARWAEQEDRQVFYLCSNPTDARAWQLALEKAGLPEPAVIDLAKARGLGVDQKPHADHVPLALEPAPGNRSPAEYANLLNVPKLNGWQEAGEVHLWHLLGDDLELLHRLILAASPTLGRWIARQDEMGALAGMTGKQVENLLARGHCIEAFLRNWRIGRGRILTGGSLDASGHISEAYREKCRVLLEEVRGDAILFLEGLRDKKVRAFRGNNIGLLEEYFRQEGYLDSRGILAADELVGNVLSAVEHEISCGYVSVSEIRVLVAGWGESVK